MKRNAFLVVLLFTIQVPVSRAAPEPQIPPAKPGTPGSILCEFFRGIAGGTVAELTRNPAFPMHPTDGELIRSFEVAANDDQQYGSVIRGYITPPATGDYTFWVAGDDAAELYLSDGEDPGHRRMIAACPYWTGWRQIDKFPEQRSEPIPLKASNRYYIEAWHKQEGGPGHLAVGWQLPDGTREMPIPGSRLAPAGIGKPAVAVNVDVAFNPATPLATAPGQHKFPNDVTVTRGALTWKMSYLLHMPDDYDRSTDRKPLFVFLCGNTHQGANLEGILNEGPAQFLNQNAKLREFWPFVGLFPQPPDGYRWDTPGMDRAVIGIIDGIVARYRIDPDRVYVSGLSMGGKGTWLVAQAAPDRFAAIAPICAVAVKPPTAADLLRYTPTWVICGSDDGGYTEGSKQMFAALKAVGGPAQITVFPNEGHGVWARFYPDPRFYQWLLKNKRDPAAAKKAAATTQPAAH